MVNSRNKGSVFERQVAADLDFLTGVRFSRNLEQVRAQDQSDLIPDDPAWPFVIECKRYAAGTGCEPAWQAQATAAAKKLGKVPAVIFKFDRRPIRASFPLSVIFDDAADFWIETSLEAFAYVAVELMVTA